MTASEALNGTKLLDGDFEITSKDAKEGDFVYFDPPYTVARTNNGFLSYNEKIFSWADQKRLATHAKKLAERGVYVMVSNAEAKEIRELYEGFTIDPVKRVSLISGKAIGRKQVNELVITSKNFKGRDKFG